MQTNTSNSPTTLEQLQTALIRRKEVVLIRRKEVERLTALSRSRIYDLMRQGKFPKPVSLGSQSVAWILREVESFIDERIAARDLAA